MPDEKLEIVVTFKGFRTLHQAKTFAEWYSGSGEQDTAVWLEEHAAVTSCNTKKIEVAPDGSEVIVSLDVQEKADE